MSRSAASVGRRLEAVAQAGKSYGMDLHADKLQLLSIRSTAEIQHANGSVIEPQSDMVYLGALISEDGQPAQELTRRRALSKVWKHSGLSRARKIKIYTSNRIWQIECKNFFRWKGNKDF